MIGITIGECDFERSVCKKFSLKAVNKVMNAIHETNQQYLEQQSMAGDFVIELGKTTDDGKLK